MSGIDSVSTDDVLLLALVKGRRVKDAAAEAGVSESTAFRRLRDAAFVAELNRVRGELWNAALGKLTQASGKAVDRLTMLIDDGESDSVRLAASVKLLELGTRLRDSVEFATRLERLEGTNESTRQTGAA